VAGRRPASSLLVIGQIPSRCRSATSFGPVCDEDSVMEFGLKFVLSPHFSAAIHAIDVGKQQPRRTVKTWDSELYWNALE